MKLWRLIFVLVIGVLSVLAPSASAQWALGDTLTVIQKPLQNIPAIVLPGGNLEINCEANPATTGWQVRLERGSFDIPLQVQAATYNSQTLWWTLHAEVPQVPVLELYDLRVMADGGLDDLARQSVKVQAGFPDEFYFVHITDTHLPTYLYYDQNGAETDSSCTISLRHITQDVNIINPAFVLLTGDLINEGELEDFLSRRYYSRAQQQLREFSVPVYLTAGNHDIGGWNDTPPEAGTARRDWWRFFGWKRLDNPPAGAPAHTQDYSFDYGPVHFVGLESYDNYDSWRWSIYGYESFTDDQLDWLQEDLSATDRNTRVLFHHHDFADELNLSSLGLDMSLSGHIHRDTEDPYPPHDIKTDNASGTNRPFRLVRFSNGQFTTQPSLEAGFDGQTMTTSYQPNNSGANDLVRVTIHNGYSQPFEHGLIKVAMPADANGFSLAGGTLLQVDNTDDPAICYIAVDLPASGNHVVTIQVDDTSPVQDALPESPRLMGASPNPFNPRTEVSFSLPQSENCRLSIFDLKGREVSVLVAASLEAGLHSYTWQGTDTLGQALPSGLYFAGLKAGQYSETHKLTLVR